MEINAYLLRERLNLGNFAAGGVVGTAAATVDVVSSLGIAQTTAGQTLTLPNPTDARNGRDVVVANAGTAAFTMYGVVIGANQFATFEWHGTWRAQSAASGPDFWRDRTASAALPDGSVDTSEGIAHFGAVHVGASNAMTGVSGFRHEAIVSYAGNGNFQNQVIQTLIPLDTNIMPAIMLRGYCYGDATSVDVQIGLYTYSSPTGTILNSNWVSKGSKDPVSIRAGYLGGMLQLEVNWPAAEYFNRYEVFAYCDGNSSYQDTWFQGWTVQNTTLTALGATNIVTVPRKFSSAEQKTQPQARLINNGTIKVSLAGEVRWTNRLITMTEGVTTREPSGYHDMNFPADGTAITVAGAAARTVTAATAGQSAQTGGLLLNAWDSLWYKIIAGTGNGVSNANYLIQPYNAASGIAPNTAPVSPDGDGWVRIVTRDDQNKFHWFNGDVTGLAGQFGGSLGETVTNWGTMKNRVNADGYFFSTFNGNPATVFGFTGGIRWIDGGGSSYTNNLGYVDVTQTAKAAGTTIYGVNGAANRTWALATAADNLANYGGFTSVSAVNRIDPAATTVMTLNDNETLFYVPQIDATGANTGTWYVAGYAGNMTIPAHWLPIVSKQNSYSNNAMQVLIGGVISTLRAGEARWMGRAEANIDMLHRRMGITHDGLKYCRFTDANFFAGAAANGLLGGAAGVLVSWDATQLMYGISDGNTGYGNAYSWINVPPAGTAIPVIATPNAGITRVVQTISGRLYIPLGTWEKLWYTPPASSGGVNSAAGDFVITYYGNSNSVPHGAVLVAAVHSGNVAAGATKTRVKFADGTYMQPGIANAVTGFIAENDQAQGTGNWRAITVAGSTGPGMSAALPAVSGITGPYAAPYNPQYRPIGSVDMPNGQIEMRGLIQMNANITAAGSVVAFMAGVNVAGLPLIMAMITASTSQEDKAIPVILRFQNTAVNGQNGVSIILASGSGNSLVNPYFTLGTSGGNAAAGFQNWLALDGIILPHA